MVCSENTPAGQDQNNIILPPDWQNETKIRPPTSISLFLPPKPTEENKYLILDPDGKTPSDYQKFLSPLDQYDKNAKD